MVNIWYRGLLWAPYCIIRNYDCMSWKVLDSSENQAGKQYDFNWIPFLSSAGEKSPSLCVKWQICTVNSCFQEQSPLAGIVWNRGKSLPLLWKEGELSQIPLVSGWQLQLAKQMTFLRWDKNEKYFCKYIYLLFIYRKLMSALVYWYYWFCV